MLILLAGVSSASMPLLEASSSKPLDQFGACFTRSVEDGGRSWAYLPSGRGGTFTDSGARNVSPSYWLQAREIGGATHLRLFVSIPSRAAKAREAVEQCR